MNEKNAPITHPVNLNEHISSCSTINIIQNNVKSYTDAVKSIKNIEKEEERENSKDVTEIEFVNEKGIEKYDTNAKNDNLTILLSTNSMKTASSAHDTLQKSETLDLTDSGKTTLIISEKPEQTVSICKIKHDFGKCEKDETNVKLKTRKNKKFNKTNELDILMILSSKSNEPVFSTGSEIESHRKDSKSIHADFLTETNTVENGSNEIVVDSNIIDLTTQLPTETMEPNSSRSPDKFILYDSDSSYVDSVPETIIMAEKHSHKLVRDLKSMETKLPSDMEHNSNGSITKSNMQDFEESNHHLAKEEPTNPEGDSSRKKKRKLRKKRKQAASKNKNISSAVCGNDTTYTSEISEDIAKGPKESERQTSSEQIKKFENDKLINEIHDTENWMDDLNKRQDTLIKEYITILKLIIREKNAFLNNIIQHIEEKNIFEMFKIANTDILNFYPMDASLDALKSLEGILNKKNHLAYKKNSVLVHKHSEEFNQIFFDFEADILDETCDYQNPSNNAENVSKISQEEKYKKTKTNLSFITSVSSSPVYVTVERALCFEYARHGIEILKEYESNDFFLKASESTRNIELFETAIKYVNICEIYISTHVTVRQAIRKKLDICIAALDKKSFVFQRNAFLNESAKEQYRKYLLILQEINELYEEYKVNFDRLSEHYRELNQWLELYKISLRKDQVSITKVNSSYDIMQTINENLNDCCVHIWHLRAYYEICYLIDDLVKKMLHEFQLEL